MNSRYHFQRFALSLIRAVAVILPLVSVVVISSGSTIAEAASPSISSLQAGISSGSQISLTSQEQGGAQCLMAVIKAETGLENPTAHDLASLPGEAQAGLWDSLKSGCKKFFKFVPILGSAVDIHDLIKECLLETWEAESSCIQGCLGLPSGADVAGCKAGCTSQYWSKVRACVTGKGIRLIDVFSIIDLLELLGPEFLQNAPENISEYVWEYILKYIQNHTLM